MDDKYDVQDEENDLNTNGVKNDNIDDGTVSNQTDVLATFPTANQDDTNNLDNNIDASNENTVVNHEEGADGLLTANKLVSKSANNLREAELRTHERPLRTKNTAELERLEQEEER